MIKRVYFILLCILFSFGFSLNYNYAQPAAIQLKYVFHTGDIQRFEVIQKSTTSQSIMGQSVVVTQTQKTGYEWHIQSVSSNGTATVKTVYKWIYIKQSDGINNTEYDTRSSQNDSMNYQSAQIGQIYSALINKSFTVEMSPYGEILNVYGADELVKAMINSMDTGQILDTKLLEEQMLNLFGDETLKEMLTGQGIVFPKNPISKGDSWETTVIITKNFPMKIVTTYTLIDFDRDKAIIDIASEILPTEESGGFAMGEMTVSFSLSGKQEGSMEIEINTGRIIKSLLNQEFSGQVNVLEGPEIIKGLSWPLNVKSIIEIISLDHH